MRDDIRHHRAKYNAMIAKARIESVKYMKGFEVHHILPRCLGGGDEPSNLVRLWPDEHLKAHRLLTLCTIGSERLMMIRVYEMMLVSRAIHKPSAINKSVVRRDALSDARTFGAMPANKSFRRESLSRAATKFLVSERTKNGSRPLTKH